jgi:hypothetical protein
LGGRGRRITSLPRATQEEPVLKIKTEQKQNKKLREYKKREKNTRKENGASNKIIPSFTTYR